MENSYNFFDRVVIRSTLLSLNQELSENHIIELAKNKFNQEAIYIASSELYHEVIKWKKNGFSKEYKNSEKLLLSLYKYFSRMSHRCTPFGLFAGCGIINVGNQEGIFKEQEVTRKTRLDFEYINHFLKTIQKNEVVFKNLEYFPNSSIYSVNDIHRYIDHYILNKHKKYLVAQFQNNEYSSKILTLCRKGSSFEELKKYLTESEISDSEAESYLIDLINNNILFSELELSVNDTSFIDSLIAKFSKLSERNVLFLEFKDDFIRIKKNIDLIDKSVGNEIELYNEISSVFNKYEINFSQKNLFQTDTLIEYKGSFPKSTLDDLKKCFTIMKPFFKKNDYTLNEFKKKFYSKFEEKEVALIEVFDPDLGIPYNFQNKPVNEQINDLLGGSDENEINEINSHDLSFLNILKIANETFIDEVDLKDFSFNENSLEDDFFSPTMSVFGKLLDNEEYDIYLNGFFGASAANLISRFSHLNIEFESIINEIQDYEKKKYPEAIVAEILHLPEERLGNIILRSNFREYDIEFLGKSKKDKSKILNIDDLFISLKNDKIVLRSKSQNKVVIPRLSCAHSYSNDSLPIYKFLCDLQVQDERHAVLFLWPDIFKNLFVYFPRVKYNKIIVSPAAWELNKKLHYSFVESDFDAAKLIELFDKYKIPQKFVLSENDNELFIDTSNVLSLNCFYSTIKNKSNITIKEHLESKYCSLVKNHNNEAVSNEFLAFFKTNKHKEVENSFLQNINVTKDREFSIGSNWIYFKIYSGFTISEELLINVIQNFVVDNFELIENWFFIRYEDPKNHIRVRFYSSDLANIPIIIIKFSEALRSWKKFNMIENFTLDTYKREIERYGNESIELCEQIFGIDSFNILEILEEITEFDEYKNELRLLTSVALINQYLDFFDFDLDTKIEFTTKHRDGFLYENKNWNSLKKVLSDKYRIKKNNLENFLNRSYFFDPNPKLYDIINKRESDLKNEISKLKLYDNALQILPSLIHMTLNRINFSDQRICELYAYDLLSKFLISKKARIKNDK